MRAAAPNLPAPAAVLTSGTRNELTKPRAWTWTFLKVNGVELTDNASVRCVKWRQKLSIGTQNTRASHFVETLRAVIETRGQQSLLAVGIQFDAARSTWHGTPSHDAQ